MKLPVVCTELWVCLSGNSEALTCLYRSVPDSGSVCLVIVKISVVCTGLWVCLVIVKFSVVCTVHWVCLVIVKFSVVYVGLWVFLVIVKFSVVCTGVWICLSGDSESLSVIYRTLDWSVCLS